MTAAQDSTTILLTAHQHSAKGDEVMTSKLGHTEKCKKWAGEEPVTAKCHQHSQKG